jgi:hypothetical protein
MSCASPNGSTQASQSVTVTVTGNGLTIQVSGDGKVTNNLNSDICTSFRPCSESLPVGTVITLTPIPTPLTGSTFVAWSGACVGTASCVITMTANLAVLASFQDLGLIGTWVYTCATASCNITSETLTLKPDGTYIDSAVSFDQETCTITGRWNASSGTLTLAGGVFSGSCAGADPVFNPWMSAYTVSGNTLNYDYQSGVVNYIMQ